MTAAAINKGPTFLVSIFHIVFFQNKGYEELKVVLTFLTQKTYFYTFIFNISDVVN